MRLSLFALLPLFCYATPTTRPSYVIDGNLLVTNWQPFQSFPDRLQQTLSPNHISNVTTALVNDGLFAKLTPLTHSELIIVYPEEFAVLSKAGVTMSEVEQIGYNNYIQYTIISLGCVKKVKLDGDSVAAVLEAKARTLATIRKQVQKLFLTKGGKKGDFDANSYSPHITLGFSSDEEWPEMKVDEAMNGSLCVADAVAGNPLDS